jgi:probable metal-binding protein
LTAWSGSGRDHSQHRKILRTSGKKRRVGAPIFWWNDAMPTTTEIHGHDVIALMLETPQPFTHASLAAAIVARFGPAARFHTCSAAGMTADEVIAFLEARGKFQAVGDGFQVNPERVCRH